MTSRLPLTRFARNRSRYIWGVTTEPGGKIKLHTALPFRLDRCGAGRGACVGHASCCSLWGAPLYMIACLSRSLVCVLLPEMCLDAASMVSAW